MVAPASAASSFSLSVTSANLHLFGRLARVGKTQKETPLYYKDFKRVDKIVAYIAHLNPHPHAVGFEEVWDPVIQHQLASGLKEIYPHRMFTPWETGVSKAIEILEEALPIDEGSLEESTHQIVKRLAQNHYRVSQPLIFNLLGRLVPEDYAVRVLQRLFGITDLWGAGLLFLSQYPIERMGSQFYPHEAKADLDRFANKGILKVVVRHPDMGFVTFLTTHLQEGRSKKAAAARTKQIQAMRQLIDKSDYPVVALGDFNIVRDQPIRETEERRQFPRHTEEYGEMRKILGLRDAFGIHNMNPDARPIQTYRGGPYARKIGLPTTASSVIDYIFHDGNFDTEAVTIDTEGFTMMEGERRIHLSDHCPVHAVLKKRSP